jgi:hypothetical protein
MNLLSRHVAFSGWAAILLCLTARAIAQDPSAAMAPSVICSSSSPCTDMPPTLTIARGQVTGAAQIGVVTTGNMTLADADSADVVKGQPYQAQAITEMKQALADGTHIVQTVTATIARDSEGRTVRIQKLNTIGPWKSASEPSQEDLPTLRTIFDPVAQTHTDYTSDRKVAHVLPLLAPPAGETARSVSTLGTLSAGAASRDAGPVTVTLQSHTIRVESVDSANSKTESLGNKTIEGIPVTGTKTTSTIPADTIGNDKEIATTRESWYSPDLKLVIQSTQSDPRFGETTYSLTNIQRNDPDPNLFQVPSGYKVERIPVVTQSQ